MSDLEDLDYSEMTTEELVEVLSTGTQVEVWLNDTLGYIVSIAEVLVLLARSMEAEEISMLREALSADGVTIPSDLSEQVENDADPGEFRLLERVLEARQRLIS